MLRLLSNAYAMRSDVYTASEAWTYLQNILSQPNVTTLPEPVGIDVLLEDWANMGLIHSPSWADAAIAAWAIKSGARVVTFDKGFQKYPGLDVLILK